MILENREQINMKSRVCLQINMKLRVCLHLGSLNCNAKKWKILIGGKHWYFIIRFSLKQIWTQAQANFNE